MNNKKILRLCTALSLIFIIAAGLFTLNDRQLMQDAFPIHQKWIKNLGEEVEALSTDGERLLFARTIQEIYALDIITGEIIWRHSVAWQAIPKPPIAWNGMLFFADGEAVWALDQTNGTTIWKAPVSNKEADVKSVSENVVAVDIDQDIAIYDAESGDLLWNKAVCRNEIQAYVNMKNVFIPCYGIIALELSSGKVLWEKKEPSRIGNVAYKDGIMYYSPQENYFSAFDLQNKKELWKIHFIGNGFRQLTILDQFLIITNSEQACILYMETGKLQRCFFIDNPQKPVKIGDTLYIFNGTQNKITAINPLKGEVLGTLSIRKLRFFTVFRELMVSADNILVFSSGNKVIGFGE